ncbi:hypothetical protein DOTSEDRAFT_70287 [Dothistroma septosporum NZE10]|uniref:Uncharacterized protein n=1 Tax=Dothistroma septosporum (strain NZE10 / CBS 128990) TaxID=675120 RepID=N1PRY7_DOTSN|nr:hypothetical protein DOTSEDRAFT_70287 [Dothistroma septosporum NZE10]
MESSRNDSVNDVEAHPARTTSLAPKAYMPEGFHELSDTGKCELQHLEKLDELDAHDSPAEVPLTPVNSTPRTADKLSGVETASPTNTHESHELDASTQIDAHKKCEKPPSYQRRTSVPLRSSLRSNIFSSCTPVSKPSKGAPPSSLSSEAVKVGESGESSAPRRSSNIEFLKNGADHHEEVIITTTRSESSFEDASNGHYSPTVSDISRPNDRNSALSAIPGSYQDGNSYRISEASVNIAEIAELSDRSSRYQTDPNHLQSPVSERFSDSPPSWMKRLSNDKSQRSSMGADERTNEANAVGPLGSEGGHDSWNHDAGLESSNPGTSEKNTALIISAASSAQRQRSRSRPRRKPVEVKQEVPDPEYDDAESRQAEQDALDIIETASPTRSNFRA